MPFVLTLLMMLCLVACGPRLGEKGPQRTKTAAEQQLSLLVSRSDRDIPSILLTEMKVHEANIVDTQYDKEGKKVTHVRWSHEYVVVSSRKVTSRKEVEIPSTAGVSVGGKPTLKYASTANGKTNDKADAKPTVKDDVKPGEQGEGKQKKEWREVTTTEYEESRATKPCDLFVTSDKGFIESLTMKGEGCVW